MVGKLRTYDELQDGMERLWGDGQASLASQARLILDFSEWELFAQSLLSPPSPLPTAW